MNSPLNLGKDWLLLTVNSMWGYRHLSPNTQRLYSGAILGAVLAAIMWLTMRVHSFYVPLTVVLGCGLWGQYEWWRMAKRRQKDHWFFVGAAYISLGTGAWIYLVHEQLWHAIFFVLGLSIVSDTAAYVVGSLVKGPKIFPTISPKKTWSGSVAGLIVASIAGTMWMGSCCGRSAFVVFGGCVVLGVCAQAGDALESAAKRYYGVKDSGALMPGHGGVLDRIDSWLSVAMVVVGVGRWLCML